jgi:hypothetical protein
MKLRMNLLLTPQLRWYRGKVLQPDPVVPLKWIPVSKP